MPRLFQQAAKPPGQLNSIGPILRLKSFLIVGFVPAAAYVAELTALDDRFDRDNYTVILRLQLGLHFGQQRFVGQLHAPAQ